ncbi:MAG: hypothetical protein J6E43_00860 [Prevotella sp.]|nr:hypothetical protein [Prevotella sp.]
MEDRLQANGCKPLRVALAAALGVLLIAVVLAGLALNYTVKAEQDVRYVGLMNLVAEKLSKTVRGVEMNAENVFDEVAKHLDSPQTVIGALGSKTSLNPDVTGYFAAFVPNYFPQEGKWFQPYVHQGDSTEFVLTLVGSARHDYTKSTWYVQGLKEKECFWSETYYYEDDLNVASGYYVTYATPIFDATGRLACVCGADMTQEWLINQLREIEDELVQDELLNSRMLPGSRDFFIVILNDDGTSFAHRDGDIVTVSDEDFVNALKQRQRGIAETEVNGKPSRVYYTPIEHTHWTVAIVVAK